MRPTARLMVTILATAAIMGSGVAAAGQPAAKPQPAAVAVGDFLVKYARAMGVRLAQNAGPSQAVAELARIGLITEEIDLSAALTEGDVVRIASRSGLRLRTLDAGRLFTSDRVDPFFQTFAGTLGPGDDGGVFEETTCDPDEANCGEGSDRAREKRKKKKDQETPPEP